MAKENGALPGLLPVVLGFLEIDNGHCCGKTDIRACSGVGAQVDQREGHEMSATQILQIAEIERERKYFDIACERIENAYRQEQMFPVDIEPARAQDALL